MLCAAAPWRCPAARMKFSLAPLFRFGLSGPNTSIHLRHAASINENYEKSDIRTRQALSNDRPHFSDIPRVRRRKRSSRRPSGIPNVEDPSIKPQDVGRLRGQPHRESVETGRAYVFTPLKSFYPQGKVFHKRLWTTSRRRGLRTRNENPDGPSFQAPSARGSRAAGMGTWSPARSITYRLK